MLTLSTRLRTSPTLVILPNRTHAFSSRHVGIFEFLSKSFSYCSIDTLYWLAYFAEWKTVSEAELDHKAYSHDQIIGDLTQLVDGKLVVIDGSHEAELSNSYDRCWEWGLPVGLFHFSILNNEYGTLEDSERLQQEKSLVSASPDLVWRGEANSAEPLPPAHHGPAGDLIKLMERRRTNRSSAKHTITRQELGTCLYAGLGITGVVRNIAGLLPLSMTPSGGARNPFEAFVLVRRGADLDPGVYRYCGFDHALAKVAELGNNRPLSQFFAGQDWVDGMAAVIVLVAMFERTMWKYQDPNAYRVVLIEAGHIAQNIMLAATGLQLTACPTAAMCHAPLAEELGLENAITHVPIYALTLDRAQEYPDELLPKSSLLARNNGTVLHRSLETTRIAASA